MNTKPSKYEFPIGEEYEGLIDPEELMSVIIERNGCMYKWGIPFKNFSKVKTLKEPLKEDDLLELGGKLLNILISKTTSINFKKSKTGVQKLNVAIISSESEDMQLLHKLSNELRLKDKELIKDSIPGTNNE